MDYKVHVMYFIKGKRIENDSYMYIEFVQDAINQSRKWDAEWEACSVPLPLPAEFCSVHELNSFLEMEKDESKIELKEMKCM